MRCEEVDRVGSGEVPKKLRDIEGIIELESFEVVQAAENDLALASDDPVEFSVPKWSAMRAQPAAAPRQEGFRPRIRFRGKELQPAVVLGTDERRIYSDRS